MTPRLLASAVALAAAASVVLGPSPANAYDRDAATNYAHTYWNTRHPAFPQGFGNDCANFASQALWAGGINMRYPSTLRGAMDLPNKWAGSTEGWTYTWSIARELWGWTTGQLGASSTYIPKASTHPANNTPGSKGDLVFYEWGNLDGNTPDHVNVRVGYGTDPNRPAYVGDRVNGHTSNRQNAIWHLWPYNEARISTAYYRVAIPNGAS